MSGENRKPHPSGRPEDPTALLVDRDIHELWQAENFKRNRFIVVNLDLVIGRIGLGHTTSKKYFDMARDSIAESGWRDLYNFEYECSQTQIYPGARSEPRQFGHAATAIVALEFAAAELLPEYNVYDKLRILPCTYYVDLFDRDQLQKVRKDPTFDERCLTAIGQEFDKQLIDQHCWGMTVTKSIADKLHAFLTTEMNGERLGPVRCAGDPGRRARKLATKNSASNMSLVTTLTDVPSLT
jgi:hypothetical protein